MHLFRSVFKGKLQLKLCCRYDIDDPEFVSMVDSIDDLNEGFGNGLLADVFPIFRYIPTPALRKIVKCKDFIFETMEKEMVEHKESFDKGLM